MFSIAFYWIIKQVKGKTFLKLLDKEICDLFFCFRLLLFIVNNILNFELILPIIRSQGLNLRL